MKRLILILLFAAQTAFGAQAWYTAVTVDHTKVPSNQTNFAVLIKQTDNRFKVTGSGGHVTSSSGFDIRPYSDAALTTALTYELDNYVSTTGELEMWVKIGSLSSTVDQVIYLGYGDSSLTTDGSSTSTWDADYKGIWHMKDGTTLAVTDSTSNANTLVNTGTVTATAGKIDGGSLLNGTSQALSTTNTVDMTATKKVTYSCWCDWTTYASNDDMMAEFSVNFNSNQAFIINPNDSGSGKFSIASHEATNGYNTGNIVRPASGMKYFVVTFDRTTGTALSPALYIDGVAQTLTQTASADQGLSFFGNYRLYIMARNAGSFFGAGTLDECRFSDILRSQDWITTEFNNQSNPGTFETLGSEVSTTVTTSTGFFLFFP